MFLFSGLAVTYSFNCPTQVWRIARSTNDRGDHIRFHNTAYHEGPLFRAALGADARANGDGFQWDRVGRYWWVSLSAAARYIGGPDGTDLDEDELTDDLMEEVVRNADATAD